MSLFTVTPGVPADMKTPLKESGSFEPGSCQPHSLAGLEFKINLQGILVAPPDSVPSSFLEHRLSLALSKHTHARVAITSVWHL